MHSLWIWSHGHWQLKEVGHLPVKSLENWSFHWNSFLSAIWIAAFHSLKSLHQQFCDLFLWVRDGSFTFALLVVCLRGLLFARFWPSAHVLCLGVSGVSFTGHLSGGGRRWLFWPSAISCWPIEESLITSLELASWHRAKAAECLWSHGSRSCFLCEAIVDTSTFMMVCLSGVSEPVVLGKAWLLGCLLRQRLSGASSWLLSES